LAKLRRGFKQERTTNMGRPRKSIADHLLHGTFRKDRHAARARGTKTNGGLADRDPPEDLGVVGAALWQQITTSIKCLDSLDAANLAALCKWYEAWHRTMELVAKQGPETSYKYVMQAATAWKQFTNLAGEFGLSPSSREKLEWVYEPPEDDPLAKFLQ